MALWKIYIVVLVPIVGTSLIFKYLVSTNKIKPNKISKIFYDDDISYINSWKEIEKKGFLRYTLKNISIAIVVMIIMGLFLIFNKRSMFGYEQSQTLVNALSIGAIFGLLDSLVGWIANQVRVTRLTEKALEKIDINNSDN